MKKRNVFTKLEELTFLDIIRVVLQETLNVKFNKGTRIGNVKVVQHLEAAQKKRLHDCTCKQFQKLNKSFFSNLTE